MAGVECNPGHAKTTVHIFSTEDLASMLQINQSDCKVLMRSGLKSGRIVEIKPDASECTLCWLPVDLPDNSPGSQRYNAESSSAPEVEFGEADVSWIRECYTDLKETLSQDRAKLEKLESLQANESKISIDELQALTEKWRTVAQEVAERIFSKVAQGNFTMIDLLEKLHIPPDIIRYSIEDETFY